MRIWRIQLSDDEIGGGPVDTEILWCYIEGKFLRVRNIPLFIEGISYDDIIETSIVEDNEHHILNIKQKSDNSTIWVVVNDSKYDNEVVNYFREIGCSVEGGHPTKVILVSTSQ